MIFKWSRTKGYECSSKGDKRFSPFFARMPDGRSIEVHYQCDVKGIAPGANDWTLGKGKHPVNGISKEEQKEAYFNLWRLWAENNDELVLELLRHAIINNYTLKDRFATSEINQANALATILNERYANV